MISRDVAFSVGRRARYLVLVAMLFISVGRVVGATNLAPVLNITAPAGNQTVPHTTTTYEVLGSATDEDGQVASIQWQVNGGAVQSTTSTLEWRLVLPLSFGGNVLDAWAIDDRGESSATVRRTITRSAPNLAPSVSITTPANGTVYPYSTDWIGVECTAADSDGGIASVQLWINGVPLTVSRNGTRWQGYGSLGIGENIIEARATDNLGATSAIARVVVNRGETRLPPSLEIVAPAADLTVEPSNSSSYGIQIRGTTTVTDAPVSTVRWRQNGGALNSALGTASWQFNADLIVGVNFFEVYAVDSAGLTSQIRTRTITRPPANYPPVVVFSQPSGDQEVEADVSEMPISGSAFDSDGTVDLVRWRVNGGELQFVTGTTEWAFTAPLSFGLNVIEVVAVDNLGLEGAASLKVLRRGVAAPANDSFSSATLILSLSGTSGAENQGASREAGEPDHWSTSPGYGTLWWKYTADAIATVNFSTCGSGIDTVMAMYLGDSVDSLELVMRNDNSSSCPPASGIQFTSTPGVTYIIAAGSYDVDSRGTLILRWTVTPNKKPVAAITSPTGNTDVAHNLESFAFSGRASDGDGRVTGVRWRVNGSPFQMATGSYTWDFSAPLIVGENLVEVQAIDDLGDVGPIVSRTINRAAEDSFSLPSTWYFAEGATLDFLQTFVLMANPFPETRRVRMDLLFESGPADSRFYDLPPNSRVTVDLETLNPTYKGGVSTVLTEVNGQGFAAERTMYVRMDSSGRWNAAHAASGVVSPEPEWFFPEGSTGQAGPAQAPFQTFILLANPHAVPVSVDVSYYPEGKSTITEGVVLGPKSRLTLEPGKRFSALRSVPFSTRVRSTGPEGILGERAMWWSDTDWVYSPFMGGTASPGLPELSNTWYFAEGDTRGFSEFILLVNPNSTTTRVTLSYSSQPWDLAPNSRTTVEVPWLQGLRHGTTIKATNLIAVERSMYWSRGRFGWVDGHTSIASPHTALRWLLAEGAAVPLAVGRMDTQILLYNPSSQPATITLRFLIDGAPPVTRTLNLASKAATNYMTIQDAALRDRGFATDVTSSVPIVVERSMYFDGDRPEPIERIGGTCSMGIPLDVTDPLKSIEQTSGFGAGPSMPTLSIPTPTPTPTVTPRRP
ncbi:hypothetical protein GC173_01540 [bacterium]|nr:hypothetical protein [bacterium]